VPDEEIMNFITRMLSSDEGIPSVNRVAMLAIILFFMLHSVFDIIKGGTVEDIPGTWLELILFLGGFTLLAKGVSAYRTVKGPEITPLPTVTQPPTEVKP
jgi:hypothetical protein